MEPEPEPETAAEKKARWDKMAKSEIEGWKREAREAKSSGSSTGPRPGKPREVSTELGTTRREISALRTELAEDLDEQAMLAQMDKSERKRRRRRKALTPGTSEFAARKSRSGTLSTKFVENLLTPGTSEFAARNSRGGPDFSGKRIDASDGQPYDFASFQEIYGPQAEELWSIAEPTAGGKKTKKKRKKKPKRKKPKGKTVKAKAKELIRTRRRRKKKK